MSDVLEVCGGSAGGVSVGLGACEDVCGGLLLVSWKEMIM